MSSEEMQSAVLTPIEAGLIESEAPPTPKSQFSDYVVYVDESGDHSLTRIDRDFPVFVLALCVFDKRHYADEVIPAVERLKFNYFGHNSVVLHEHSIRKQKGAFAFLNHHPTRIAFIERLTSIMESSEFALISCLVDKTRLRQGEQATSNPYHIALQVCLEVLHEFLTQKRQERLQTHVVVECRGKKEDAELAKEFRRICDRETPGRRLPPLDIVFADKKTNLIGLQLADLVARPIGLSHIRPQQKNRAFELLAGKFFRHTGRAGAGDRGESTALHVYPPQKAKSPDESIEAATPTGNPQSTCAQV